MRLSKVIRLIFAFAITFTTLIAHGKPSKNNCDKSPPTQTVAILVDVSEPLDVPNKMSYEKVVERILGNATKFTRFDVYKIAGNSSGVGEPEISLCNPSSSSNSSLMQGEKYWTKKRNKEFYEPLKEVLISLGNNVVPGQSSPILESFFSMSLKSFTNSKFKNGMPGQVIVISDFMQHSDQISFYGNPPSYSSWRNSPKGRSWVRSFGNVSFEAIVIPRAGSSTLPKNGRDFFVSYFYENFQSYTWRDLASSVNPGN